MLDGKNIRHGYQYFLSFKKEFGRMVKDYDDLMARVMVVLTKVDRKIVHEKCSSKAEGDFKRRPE